MMIPTTEADYRRAAVELESYAPDMRPPLDDAEVWCVLDALANGDDPADHLEEHRMYRTPHGSAAEAYDAFESGRPMGVWDR